MALVTTLDEKKGDATKEAKPREDDRNKVGERTKWRFNEALL